MNIPAPGGSVGPKGFLVYVAGGTLGVYLYANVLTNYIPDKAEQFSLGPISGTHIFLATSALLGAAMASKIL